LLCGGPGCAAGETDMDPKPIPYHDLMRALAPDVESELRRCPICRLVTESIARHLDDLIFFSAVKPDIRAEIRAARGFCNEHASQLAQLVGKGLGVALIHEDIIDTVIEGLEQAVPSARRAPALPAAVTSIVPGRVRPRSIAAKAVHALEPKQACPACRHQLLVEESYLGALWRYLDDAALAAALRASPGLCLPHLRQALPAAPDAAALRRLIEIEIDCLGRLRAELRELTRKFDHRFKHEAVGPEADAWLRAINQVSGVRGIR
jgi:hypothetical protein